MALVYTFILPLLILICCVFYDKVLYYTSYSVTSDLSTVRKRTVNNDVSSVWCQNVENSFLCTFRNLYYLPGYRQFIFILTPGSLISGIGVKELKSLKLSSVMNHNRLTLNLVIVTDTNILLHRSTFDQGSVFLMWRFKWDNIMHVLHDDLIPLYFTYATVCSGNIDYCTQKYRLAFIDGGEKGSLFEWYEKFSNQEPLLLSKVSNDTLLLLSEARVGLIGNTVWFQYGFGMPQGPVLNCNMHGNALQHFINFTLGKFEVIKKVPLKDADTISVFNRKLNRRIMNENYLENVLRNTYHFFLENAKKINPVILKMDLSSNETVSILKAVVKSKIVVGMHGSAMILCLFLQPGSLVVELFPFGINPQYVSPLKALSELPGLGIIYNSWENRNESNSYPHPNAPSLSGGILHLSEAEQESIKQTKNVPAVECCHNATYLYRMFQDTVVDSSFISVFERALVEQYEFSWPQYKRESRNILLQYYFPAQVTDVVCATVNNALLLTWSPPMNVVTNEPLYDVLIVINKGLQFSFFSKEPQVTVPLPSSIIGRLYIDVWVKSIVLRKESMDVHTYCQISV